MLFCEPAFVHHHTAFVHHHTTAQQDADPTSRSFPFFPVVSGWWAHRPTFTRRLRDLLRAVNHGQNVSAGREPAAKEYSDLVQPCPGEAEVLCGAKDGWSTCTDSAKQGRYEGPLCAVCNQSATKQVGSISCWRCKHALQCHYSFATCFQHTNAVLHRSRAATTRAARAQHPSAELSLL